MIGSECSHLPVVVAMSQAYNLSQTSLTGRRHQAAHKDFQPFSTCGQDAATVRWVNSLPQRDAERAFNTGHSGSPGLVLYGIEVHGIVHQRTQYQGLYSSSKQYANT